MSHGWCSRCANLFLVDFTEKCVSQEKFSWSSIFSSSLSFTDFFKLIYPGSRYI